MIVVLFLLPEVLFGFVIATKATPEREGPAGLEFQQGRYAVRVVSASLKPAYPRTFTLVSLSEANRPHHQKLIPSGCSASPWPAG